MNFQGLWIEKRVNGTNLKCVRNGSRKTSEVGKKLLEQILNFCISRNLTEAKLLKKMVKISKNITNIFDQRAELLSADEFVGGGGATSTDESGGGEHFD